MALKAWREALEHYFSGYGGAVGPFGQALESGPSPIADACQWLIATSGRILAEAKAAGEVRPDLRGEDIYLAALITAWASQLSTTGAETVQARRRTLDRGSALHEN